MYFYLREPLSSITSSNTSFSSDNSYLPNINPSAGLRQLSVDELDEINSTGFNRHDSTQRESYNISRSLFAIPRPTIYLPTNNLLSTPCTRFTHARQSSRSSNPSLITHHRERPIYQNVSSLPVLPPVIPSYPIQYQIQRYAPIPVTRSKKQQKSRRERPPGLFTTLFTGGFSTISVLIYLIFLLSLPIAKLVLGILYMKECPVNRNIPLYMIVAGACGLTLVILLLLSSACTLCRSTANTKKPYHCLMICTISLARGLQGVIGIFLFIWFLFGNIWIFNARVRVRTDKPNDINNYCHPTLYWFAYYILIFTYIYAFLTCCIKFCLNCFCCGAFNEWHKAFS
ncbi:unnamed protein product [Adineta steineri]|uniref:Uncharacterized protein n=1 Tax=Adineta steineri TaxID=433720 RepID=A0A815M829_9BILA|nr:unnamed protein product [Adineta steineri]